MDPVAFQIGPLEVRWYGILIATALALGTYLAYREAARQKIHPDHVLNIVIVAMPLAFIGARIYYVVFRWFEYYRFHPSEIFAIWHGGLAIHGALLFGVLGGFLVVRRSKLNFWQMADIVAPSIILGQALGRWGNFFNQEAYGYPTDLPWGIYVAGAYRHPTFLYESLWNFAVFVFLVWFRKREATKSGEIFLSYLVLYSFGRFFVEGFRTDSLMLGPLRVAQVLSIALIVGGIYLIWRRKPGAQLYNRE